MEENVQTKKWGKYSIIYAFSMLIVILLRLVWMQLHVFEPVVPEKTAITISYAKNLPGKACQTTEMEAVRRRPFHSLMKNFVSLGLAGEVYASCKKTSTTGVVDFQRIIKWNTWLYILTGMLGILACRFLTRSWTVSLLAGAVVMGKGSLGYRVADISSVHALSFFFTLWFAGFAHFLRTGATFSFAVMMIAPLLGAFFDFSFIALSLVFPILLPVGYVLRKKFAEPVLGRLRSLRRFAALRGDEPVYRKTNWLYSKLMSFFLWTISGDMPERRPVVSKNKVQRGGVFSTLDVPFSYWVYYKNRWVKIGLLTVSVVLITFMVLLLFYQYFFSLAGVEWSPLNLVMPFEKLTLSLREGWLWHWALDALSFFDIQYGLSLLVVIFCGFQSPAKGLMNFLEAIWVFVAGTFVFVFFALVLDAMDRVALEGIAHFKYINYLKLYDEFRETFSVIEPTLLMLGVASVYQLLKIGSQAGTGLKSS